MTEVGAPAPKEPVDGADDRLNGPTYQVTCGEFPDPVSGAGHGTPGWPSRQEVHPRLAARRHPPEVEPQEVEALAAFEVDHPSLGWLDAQPEPGEFLLQHDERPFRLGLVPADDHEIIRVADEPPQPAVTPFPLPVEPVEVDVGEQGRDDPALRCAGVGGQQLFPDEHPRRSAAPGWP